MSVSQAIRKAQQYGGSQGDQGAHPDASWPKILGNRSGCACVMESKQKTDNEKSTSTFTEIVCLLMLPAEEGKLRDRTFQSTRSKRNRSCCCCRGAYLGLPRADVAAADGGGDDLDADLQGPRRGHLHLLHHQRLPRPPRHRRCAQAIQFYAALQAAGIQSKGNSAEKQVAARSRAGWARTSAGDGGRRRRKCSVSGHSGRSSAGERLLS